MSLIEMCDFIDLPTGNDILKSLNKQQLQAKKNIEKVIQERLFNKHPDYEAGEIEYQIIQK